MAQYATLKAAIDAVIKANGQREITGTVLNQTLNAMVNSLGADYQFAGVATPSTNPGTPDQNVFYLAGQGGTYSNFNNIVLPDGVSILMWNGSWSSQTVLAGDGGVFDISDYKATGGTLATFADLSAALDGGNNVPDDVRRGGMQVRFVQTSDNNYVQYRLISNSFTTIVSKWMIIDNYNEVNFKAFDMRPTYSGERWKSDLTRESGGQQGCQVYDITEFRGMKMLLRSSTYILNKTWLGNSCFIELADSTVINLSTWADSKIRTDYKCLEFVVPATATHLYFSGHYYPSGAITSMKPLVMVENPDYDYNHALFKGKKISIIGASIEAWNTSDWCLYPTHSHYPTGDVTNITDMWWYRLIYANGGSLEVNASWLGSCGTTVRQSEGMPSLNDRISVLGNPDIIFIASLVLNDSYKLSGVYGDYKFTESISDYDESKFIDAYIKGIRNLKTTYPNAQIILFVNYDTRTDYKKSIKVICDYLGVMCIDLTGCKLNNVHPNAQGMSEMAAVAKWQIENYALLTTDNDNNVFSLIGVKHGNGNSSDVYSFSDAVNLVPSYMQKGGITLEFTTGSHNTYNNICRYVLNNKTFSTNRMWWRRCCKYFEMPSVLDNIIKELYINGNGVASDISMIHNIRKTSEGLVISFANYAGTAFTASVLIPTTSDYYTPIPIMYQSQVCGYIIIDVNCDLSFFTTGQSYIIQARLTDETKSLANSPTINAYLMHIDINNHIDEEIEILDDKINILEVGSSNEKRALLYSAELTSSNQDIIEQQSFDSYGMIVTSAMTLNKIYNVNDRTIKCFCKFSSDTVALFQFVSVPSGYVITDNGVTINVEGEFKLDIENKTVQCMSLQAESCSILNSTDEFMVEIHRDYSDRILTITNMYTGDTWQHTWTYNGCGGTGRGAVSGETEVNAGRCFDYYRFNLSSGNSYSISKIIIDCKKADLVMYGDSVTNGDAYWPSDLLSKAWPQLIIEKLKGNAVTSAKSGTRAADIMFRIVNEIPYIKPKYVMITIGTNGQNTVSNLSQIVDYITSQGAICILNHIPANDNGNDTGNQVAMNAIIDQVRSSKSVSGADLDIPTSLAHDGVDVDKTQMWWEDYNWAQIWHHPNVKGSATIFARILRDLPEVFTY